MRLSLVLIIFTFSVSLLAQDKFVLSGYIKDKDSNEPLLYSNVSVKDSPKLGVAANDYGFFSLQLPRGKQTLVFSYLGYKDLVVDIDLTQDLRKDFFLVSESSLLEEVVLIDNKVEQQNVKGVETSVVELQMQEVNAIPVVFGEKDILKALQFLPGVTAAAEGSANFLVRGGSSDQNLVLLDEAQVYNTSHFLGFFSTFNSDVIKDLTLMKGQYPAEFGGRLSSLLNIKMKEGNSKNFSGSGGIGLISSRLSLEIPVIEGKSSLLIAGRRTYADLIARPFLDEENKNLKLYFYDVNMKFNWEIDDKNKIFLSGFLGKDALGGLGSTDIGIEFANTTFTALWNHIFTPKLFVNTSFIYSLYDFDFQFSSNASLQTDIQDFNLKQTYSYFYSPKSKIKFGFSAMYHTYTPSKLETKAETSVVNFYALEHGVFVSHSYDFTDNLKAVYGVRYTGFSLLGPSDDNTFDQDGNIEKTENPATNTVIQYYDFWEPRLSLNYLLDEQSSIKLGIARNAQYLHVITSSNNGGTPIDTYMPSTKNLKPQKSHQASLGYFFNILDNTYEFSVEVYGKETWDLSDYKENADPFTKEGIEGKLTFGRGNSYGIEFFAKKRKGDFTGWISYTLSRTESIFDQINVGKPFLSPQDRTHSLSVIGMYALGNWQFSAAFSFVSGRPTTYPAGRYLDITFATPVSYYKGRNTYRWPSSHRLDVSAIYNFSPSVIFGKNFDSELAISIYNVYHQLNPFSIDPYQSKDSGEYGLQKISLYGIVPTITWNFTF